MQSIPSLLDLKSRVDHEEEVEDEDTDDLDDVPRNQPTEHNRTSKGRKECEVSSTRFGFTRSLQPVSFDLISG